MFNLMSFATSKNAESGIIGSTLTSIRALLTHLLHSPETGVVKLTVAAGQGPIPYGYVVGIIQGNKETCRKAIAGELTAKAVCLDKSTGGLASEATGYFRMTGIADVALVSQLNPSNGDRIVMSETTGKGTNTAGAGIHRQIGWIVDNTGYATTGLVKVLLDWDEIIV